MADARDPAVASNDAEFRRAIRGRVRSAWDRLAKMYGSVLLRQASRLLPAHMDPENAVQDVWFRALVRVRTYDTRFSPFPWLARICANVCHNARRRRHAKTSPFDGDAVESRGDGFADEAADRREALTAALASLPERQRETLTLRYAFQVPVEEIAALLRATPNAVHLALFDGLKRLRNGPAAESLAAWGEFEAPGEARGAS
jgi:RNA polymerase sigma factor (sigma-70 family)